MNDSQPPLENALARPLPPLRIYHFFLWSIAVAAVLASVQLIVPARHPAIAEQLTSWFWTLVPLTIAAATLLCGLGWRWKGLPFFKQPGHWLLLTLSINFLIAVLQVAPIYLFFGSGEFKYPPSEALRYLGITESVLQFALAVFYLTAACKLRMESAWRNFFGVLLAITVMQYVLAFVSGDLLRWLMPAASMAEIVKVSGLISMNLSLIAIPFCILAVRSDFTAKRRRHWSHWCGVALWVSSTLLGVALALYTASQPAIEFRV